MQAQQQQHNAHAGEPRAPRMSSGVSTASSPTSGGGPPDARMRSESGRLLTAEERQAILSRFRSVSQDHLFPNQSHLLSRSSQTRRLPSRQTPDAGGAADDYAAASAAQAAAEAAAMAISGATEPGTGGQQAHPPRTSSGGGVVIGQPARTNASSSSIRHNKSESSLATTVHTKALASAVRRGVVAPSPLKFAAARAMSRRQISSSQSSLSSLGSISGMSSSFSGMHLARSGGSASAATSPGGWPAEVPMSAPASGGASGGADSQGGADSASGGGGGGGGGGRGGVPGERPSLAWLSPDDIEQRKVFLSALIRQGLPLPRSELDYHAARVFIDLENRSV
jgi:hypothetical protein